MLNRLPNIGLGRRFPATTAVGIVTATRPVAAPVRIVARVTTGSIGVVATLATAVGVRTALTGSRRRCRRAVLLARPVTVAGWPIATLPIPGRTIGTGGYAARACRLTARCRRTATNDAIPTADAFPFLFIGIAATALPGVVDRQFDFTQNFKATQLVTAGCPDRFRFAGGSWFCRFSRGCSGRPWCFDRRCCWLLSNRSGWFRRCRRLGRSCLRCYRLGSRRRGRFCRFGCLGLSRSRLNGGWFSFDRRRFGHVHNGLGRFNSRGRLNGRCFRRFDSQFRGFGGRLWRGYWFDRGFSGRCRLRSRRTGSIQVNLTQHRQTWQAGGRYFRRGWLGLGCRSRGRGFDFGVRCRTAHVITTVQNDIFLLTTGRIGYRSRGFGTTGSVQEFRRFILFR